MVFSISVAFPLLICLCLWQSSQALLNLTVSATYNPASPHRLPVVFVYTVVEQSCQYGLPSYIKTSIEQALFTQPDCDVVLLSNVGECAKIAESVNDLAHLHLVDSVPITSSRSKHFLNASYSMFESHAFNGVLWVTSALRFFMIEDFMQAYNLTELMHIEADNMVYGRYTTLLPILRKHYPLTATPLNVQETFITASVFWISSFPVLISFNNYLLNLGTNQHKQFSNFLDWIRPHACCKPGGIFPDAQGRGLRPFAINEMSMLAYYHNLFPQEFKLLPVVPAGQYVLNKFVVNMTLYAPGGDLVGPATGHGVWDPNSWGQYIGGTHSKRGRDKGFTDSSHIAGQAIRTTSCQVQMLCGNMTEFGYASELPESFRTMEARCYTAPLVRCGETAHWTPLWNLHVHSKHTISFKSELCPCPQK